MQSSRLAVEVEREELLEDRLVVEVGGPAVGVQDHSIEIRVRVGEPRRALVVEVCEGPVRELVVAQAGRIEPPVTEPDEPTGSDGNVLIGTVVTALPTYVPVAVLVLYEFVRSYEREGRRALISGYGLILAITLAVMMSASVVIVVGLVLYVVTWIIERRRKATSRPNTRQGEDPLAYVLAVIGFPLIMFVTTTTTPWLPPEAITSNGVTFLGYVTSSDDQWTHILINSPRQVQIFATKTITNRVICQLPSGGRLLLSLPQLIVGPSTLPNCPTP